MHPIRRLAFVVNPDKSGASGLAKELIALARQAGVKKTKLTNDRELPRDCFRNSDACCVIGGDGTLLGTVRAAAEANIPIIGINQGTLGFLTTFSAEEALAHSPALLAGDFCVATRSLLECNTGSGKPDIALNDVLVKNEFNSRLIRLEVVANGNFVTEFYCDGLVFSTPTGSTAYNLAAGGPIIHPSAAVIAMTPICPHTLSNRSVIFRDNVKIQVFNRSNSSRLLVAMDGQRNALVTEGSPIEISISKRSLLLAQHKDYSHYEVLRTKLKWSGGVVEKNKHQMFAPVRENGSNY